MTMTMTNVLLNINTYSDTVKYSLLQSLCKKIILNQSTNLCSETIIEAKTTLERMLPPKRSKFTNNYEF